MKKEVMKRIDEWQKENVDRIVIKARKDTKIKERIDIASNSAKQSKNQYIIDAIETRLKNDGF